MQGSGRRLPRRCRPAGRRPVNRAFVGAPAIIALGLLPLACRDVIAGSATNLPEALCDTLSSCEGACPPDLVTRVEDADDSVRGDFLSFAAKTDCTTSCSGARLCRDQPPICEGLDLGCKTDVDCCRSAVGLSSCEAGRCCRSLGAPCKDGDDCCEGEACAANHRCGGVTCTLTLEDAASEDDARCTSSFECCSHRCEDGFCVAHACSNLGESCLTDGDCCSQPGPSGKVKPACDAATHRCVDSTAECDVCEPSTDPEKNCCLASGAVCYVLVDGSSTCGFPTCSPKGGDCASDDDCCQTDELTFCDVVGQPHCASLPGCGISGVICDDASDCCSGLCLGGVCASGEGCLDASCHSPCSLGGPLVAADATECGFDPTCAQTVCDTTPACCCQEWSAACRAKYETQCPGSCL